MHESDVWRDGDGDAEILVRYAGVLLSGTARAREVIISRELTITLSDDVYEELKRRAGQDDISHCIEHLVRPVGEADGDLEAGYRAMAADQGREREAREWDLG